MTPWSAILGPANLPADIVEKLNKATIAAFAKPDVWETLSKQGSWTTENLIERMK